MKIKYSRYTGEDFGIDGNDLLQALSDFLLESGFNTQYMPFSEWNQHSLEDLKKAIQQALEDGRLFDDQQLQEMMQRLQNLSPEQMQQLLDRLVQKMIDEGHISIEQQSDARFRPRPHLPKGIGELIRSPLQLAERQPNLPIIHGQSARCGEGMLGYSRHDASRAHALPFTLDA